mgnify:CR=1 FL=1
MSGAAVPGAVAALAIVVCGLGLFVVLPPFFPTVFHPPSIAASLVLVINLSHKF